MKAVKRSTISLFFMESSIIFPSMLNAPCARLLPAGDPRSCRCHQAHVPIAVRTGFPPILLFHHWNGLNGQWALLKARCPALRSPMLVIHDADRRLEVA